MSDIEVGSVWQGKNNEGDVVIVWANQNRVHYDYLNSLGNPMKDVYDKSAANFLEYFEPKTDMVNHPPHYKDASGIECIEVTKYMSFLGGNCFKYLYRAGKKGSTIEDLKKAAWYADRAWENEEVVLIAPMRLIEKIAVHREGNIKQAMLYIAEDFWAMAKRNIEAEIARLESE